ncbi:MAG TPA: hypothetical protein VF980_17350 [Thermoanaerobaculia bacterium]
MQTTELPSVAADRHLHRLVNVEAWNQAAAALHTAASHAPDDIVLASADAIFGGTADEATRARLRDAVLLPEFTPVLRNWMREMREVASAWPDSGACTVATALKLWSFTFDHFRATKGHAVDELADALCPLIAARCFVIDAVLEKEEFRFDLSHVYAAHWSAVAGATCAELVFGYRTHLVWDAEGCATCYSTDELDEIESVIPGFAAGAGTTVDIIGNDRSHPAKRGPCARVDGLEMFMRIRSRLDSCLTGARIAKDRAVSVMARRP